MTPTPTGTPGCSAPLPVDGQLPDGYVQATSPADGTLNVPLATNTLVIVFNQPMQSSGAGGANDKAQYTLKRVSDNKAINIGTAVYNSATYTTTLTFNNTDPTWGARTWYYLTVKGGVKNFCGQNQVGTVNVYFKTEDNLPTPTATLTPTATTGTPVNTPTATSTPGCTAPLPVDGALPDGFVANVVPADGTLNVPITTTTVKIYFNQPMMTGGGGGSAANPANYELKRSFDDHAVSLLSAIYNASDYSVTLTFNSSDVDWNVRTWYYLKVKGGIQNACGSNQGKDVLTYFKTEDAPTGCMLPLPVDGALPDGFVQAITPSDGTTSVPLSTRTVIISFNQRMKYSAGAGSADDNASYELKRSSDNKGIPILSVSYDPASYTATVTFDNTRAEWGAGTWYYFNVKGGVQNECGDKQNANVTTYFKTQDTILTTPTPTATPTGTLMATSTPACTAPLPVDGTLPDGFVQNINPADATLNVPLSMTTINVQFNQPMLQSGAGSPGNAANYELKRASDDHVVSLVSVAYDPLVYTATISFNNTDPDWNPLTWYYFKVKAPVQNICAAKQNSDVIIYFKTADNQLNVPVASTATPTGRALPSSPTAIGLITRAAPSMTVTVMPGASSTPIPQAPTFVPKRK
jgi:hypothetical protein